MTSESTPSHPTARVKKTSTKAASAAMIPDSTA